ncbi:ROK family protein [Roseibacillus persicicus]|uniref:Glucokinase n=1 Tax=Roseibacillus persicicus TaxID=454148 RepID=A0A918WF69_9BACT|nr:ROK family protein [Roseibacillus persicicus]MDQ8192594.1 ROK family protein [Roseibacillus persicicus]GHC40180.1 glucokinase [Roseibacillus persicicus]
MKQAIGIDFGGTTVKIGVVEGSQVLDKAPPIATQDYLDATTLIDDIARTVHTLQESFPNICAIGAGMPGFVDFPTGRVHNLTNVQGWKNVFLKKELEDRLHLPATIDNDANAMAYAEWKVGAGMGMNHLVAITLGTGVGGGLIIDGKLARGANSVGSELGHVSINYKGRTGPYGNHGGLEEYIGNNEIVARARELYREAGHRLSLDDCSPKTLAESAQAGDPIALLVWDGIAEKLACALTSTVFLLNPEAIIIGGGVSKAGPLLFKPLQEKLFSQIGDPFKEHLQILPAHFGNEAGMLGAANLALETFE